MAHFVIYLTKTHCSTFNVFSPWPCFFRSFLSVIKPKNQLLQVILLRLSKMHVLTRSCKTVVLARSSKRTLQDLPSTCKTHQMQDGARGSCKYLQDLILARSSKSIFQVLARLSKTNVWQDGARWSYKILQEWPRPLFGKMEQDDLVRYCKIDQDGHSSKIKQD